MNNFSILEWRYTQRKSKAMQSVWPLLRLYTRAAYDTGCLHEAVQAAGGHLPPV